MKRLILIALILLPLLLTGCGGLAKGSEDLPYRTWKHIELHILKFYKQFVELHREMDIFIFGIDPDDPDSY